MTSWFGRVWRNRFHGVAVGAGLLVLALPVAAGHAAPSSTRTASLPAATQPLDARGQARPVAAWRQSGQASPAEWAVDPAEPALTALTPEVWRTVAQVNRGVNARIKPRSDQDHWGVVDRWSYPDDGHGDCEDYQLLKRRMLAARGLPRRAMRMTVVIDEKGEGHAVLTLRTDRGDLVLDNKTHHVLPWAATGYTFVKRESEDGATWVSLGGVSSPTVTANR